MKLIVFDCDGTIVDSQAGIVLSMEHAFKSLRMVPPRREQILAVIGLSLPLVRRLAADLGIFWPDLWTAR